MVTTPKIYPLYLPSGMKKFERAGSAQNSWIGKKSYSKEETAKRVAKSLSANQCLSLRHASKLLKISGQKST